MLLKIAHFVSLKCAIGPLNARASGPAMEAAYSRQA